MTILMMMVIKNLWYALRVNYHHCIEYSTKNLDQRFQIDPRSVLKEQITIWQPPQNMKGQVCLDTFQNNLYQWTSHLIIITNIQIFTFRLVKMNTEKQNLGWMMTISMIIVFQIMWYIFRVKYLTWIKFSNEPLGQRCPSDSRAVMLGHTTIWHTVISTNSTKYEIERVCRAFPE